MNTSARIRPHTEQPKLKRGKVGYGNDGTDGTDDKDVKNMTAKTQQMNID